MSEAQTSFLDKPAYPIIFMIILTVVFVGILAVFYRSTEKGIAIRKQQSYQTQVLSLFADTLATLTGKDKSTFVDMATIQTTFPRYIKELKQTSMKGQTISSRYFEASIEPNKPIGYCYDVTGSGLWGTMHGLLAVTPDSKKIINFIIYDNMETPGLGARVSEPWFKNQFAGKPLFQNNSPSVFTLIPEAGIAGPVQVRQITGATITSSSVLKIIQAAAGELSGFNAAKKQ